jgi:Zn-dependent peptidase ImmA (M78 family)
MDRRKQLVMNAMAAALKVRRTAGITLWNPVCVYDLADQLEVEVRFVDIPSMEGMYCKNDLPAIFVSSLRPTGRQAFTCGHELGHHVFKHGSRIDKMIEQTSAQSQFDPEEFTADSFAGFLLMPKSAVERAFTLRGWDLHSCTPLQLYTIAGWLGVGYTTLVYHMSNTLNLIPQSSVRDLMKVSPNKIRSARLGKDINENLVIVDEYWSDRAIDIQVGDLIQLPIGTVNERDCVQFHSQDENGSFFVGMAPGRGRLYQPSTGWSAYVRVSRRDYVGRSIFRHLEDSPDD